MMETMTKGRVYVTVGGEELLSIIYFDKDNMRVKEIDLDHKHNNQDPPHTHHGYLHNENDGPKGAANLTPEEKKMVDRVKKVWYDYLEKNK